MSAPIGKRTDLLIHQDPCFQKFVRDVNFGFRLGWADHETAQTLMNGRNLIPQTLVLTSDGHVISHWRGYSRGQSRDHLRDVVSRALAEINTSARKQQF